MADIDKLSDEIKLVPNGDPERRRARLAVAEQCIGGRHPQMACATFFDMLGLWPGQEEHAPRHLSTGRLTNSTMIRTSDARRRAGR